ncbi:SRPBCC family protein [Aeromicrobium choanae]|uniref:Polyketide cyclase / dehydrase and lipid transport n=1 Tax=Aeromicrobium choanae TaxID=1736691 RepID=A0A1T4YSZ0_9ACTN|nr:SRPBCC family protein [Aeromicrobium choanae]SKB04698.1 Polyketide cyclase / dehydrase and lipid transport [Aeromicrobium choanae]
MESRHVSRVIAASPQDVYEFAVAPANLPRWASGLAEADVEVKDDHLVVQSPMGEVRVRFVPRNSFGILDHDVTLPSGATVTNPLRVLAHPDGAEVVFTVRQLDLSDEEFEQDARTIAKDLDALAALLES